MIKSNVLIVARFLGKNKMFCFINLFGLALGIACFSIVLLFVEFEFSYDKFHRNPENVYRVTKDFVNQDGNRIPDASTPAALASALRTELSQVEGCTRFMANGGRHNLLEYEGKRFYELNLLRIDSSFFRVFDFQFVKGSRQHPFNGIHSILLTETTAHKYFGDQDPIGKTIRTNINNNTEFEVTGVLKDVPANSHFTFDILIPFESRRDADTDWGWHGFYTYARLKPGSDGKTLESQIAGIIKKHVPGGLDEYYVQPLTDIHLTSRLKSELAQNGDLQYVRILLAIGVFVLVIAIANYVNLVTAQSVKRAREVGIKKSMGAVRSLLAKQFLIESLIMVMIASLFAVVITGLTMPFTNQVLGVDLAAFLSHSRLIWLALPGCIFGIAILAGIYPALYLSSLHPCKVLKGKFFKTSSGFELRQGLVVFQFVMSSVMIIGFIAISKQIQFIRNKNLGFDPQNVLMVPNVIGIENPEAIAEEFRKIASVESVARASGGILGFRNSVNGISDEHGGNHMSLNFMRIDYDYIPTLRIGIKDGRNFSPLFISDSTGIIINETAVAQLGLKQPVVGQQIVWDDDSGETHRVTIVGVTKDFHFTSFYQAIKPFGFILEVDNGSTFFLRINSTQLRGTLAEVEKAWRRHCPDKPFDYSFQDEQMASLHFSEERFRRLFTTFTALAITISCLGLFGLMTAVTEAKTKEIGIRKVLGASVAGVVGLLTKEFMKLIAMALVIAMPLAYFMTDKWLQQFAYRIDMTWPIFVLTAVVTFTIAFLTVCLQSTKAALANPVISLRSE